MFEIDHIHSPNWAERLNSLHYFAQSVFTGSQEEEVMEVAVNRARELFRPATTLLAMVEHEVLRYAVAPREDAYLFAGAQPLQESVIRAMGRVLIDPAVKGWAAPDVSQPVALKSLISAPIQVEDEAPGSLTAFRTHDDPAFNQDDVALLSLFTDYVALALKHTRVCDQLRQEAHLDPLTSLYNRRALTERMDREIARAGRDGRGFSTVLLDIDNFKQVNDVYGHFAGDGVLVQLARRLERSIRSSDIVARYGGDEFLLILTNTGRRTAFSAVERIQREVGLLPFQVQHKINCDIRVSMGVASCPEDGYTRDELIHAADLALLRAKSQLSNRQRA